MIRYLSSSVRSNKKKNIVIIKKSLSSSSIRLYDLERPEEVNHQTHNNIKRYLLITLLRGAG